MISIEKPHTTELGKKPIVRKGKNACALVNNRVITINVGSQSLITAHPKT